MNRQNKGASKIVSISVKVIIVVVVFSAFLAFFARLPESNSYFTSSVNSGQIVITTSIE